MAMNLTKKTSPTTPRQSRICAVVALTALATGLLGSQPARAAELLQNGSFALGMTGWKTAPALGDFNPYSAGVVALHPSTYGYSGLILYQNLNVTNVSGQTLTLSASLQTFGAGAGRTVAVYLDYVTASSQVKRILALNPDNSLFSMSYTAVTNDIALPDEAVKLVRLVVSTLDSGQFNANQFSLSGTGLTPGALPTLAGVAPSMGAYYSTTNSGIITLRGSNFGSVAGQVLVACAPVDAVGLPAYVPIPSAQIVTWTTTQVVARVVEPMASGKVYVVAGNVESQGDVRFTVTSPGFTVSAVTPTLTALRGQTATAIFRVDALNGFQTASGMTFMTTMPIVALFTSTPLFHSGGFSLDLDTTSQTNGDYIGVVQSMEDHSYARFTPYNLKVRSITNIAFSVGYPAVSITSLTVTNQNEFTYNFSYQLIDNTGAPFSGNSGVTPPNLSVISDNPAVVFVFTGGFGPRFFAVANGSANLVFTTADGYSKSLPVTVALSGAASFTSRSIIPALADNSGTSTNTIFWQATQDITWIGYEGMVGFSFDGISYDYINHTATWTFGVPQATLPGAYLLYAQTGPDGAASKSFVGLNVVNTANKGQIAGSVMTVDAGGSFMMQETTGYMEVYDSATGAGVVTNHIWNFNSTAYLVSYLSPGVYRLRWVPDNTTAAPQWFPQAATFAEAGPIQVQAGQTVTNINFYVRPVPVAPANLSLPTPVWNGTERAFNTPTVAGVTYVLEYKDSLGDLTWKQVQAISGTGDTLVLADPAAAPAQRFYRLRMQTP